MLGSKKTLTRIYIQSLSIALLLCACGTEENWHLESESESLVAEPAEDLVPVASAAGPGVIMRTMSRTAGAGQTKTFGIAGQPKHEITIAGTIKPTRCRDGFTYDNVHLTVKLANGSSVFSRLSPAVGSTAAINVWSAFDQAVLINHLEPQFQIASIEVSTTRCRAEIAIDVTFTPLSGFNRAGLISAEARQLSGSSATLIGSLFPVVLGTLQSEKHYYTLSIAAGATLTGDMTRNWSNSADWTRIDVEALDGSLLNRADSQGGNMAFSYVNESGTAQDVNLVVYDYKERDIDQLINFQLHDYELSVDW